MKSWDRNQSIESAKQGKCSQKAMFSKNQIHLIGSNQFPGIQLGVWSGKVEKVRKEYVGYQFLIFIVSSLGLSISSFCALCWQYTRPVVGKGITICDW